MAKNVKKPKVTGRVIFFTICAVMCFVILAGRVGYLQFVRGAELKAGMLEQETRDKEITKS